MRHIGPTHPSHSPRIPCPCTLCRSFLMSALVSADILLIRFFLCLAYIFLLVNAALGFPRWPAMDYTGGISVDSITWCGNRVGYCWDRCFLGLLAMSPWGQGLLEQPANTRSQASVTSCWRGLLYLQNSQAVPNNLSSVLARPQVRAVPAVPRLLAGPPGVGRAPHQLPIGGRGAALALLLPPLRHGAAGDEAGVTFSSGGVSLMLRLARPTGCGCLLCSTASMLLLHAALVIPTWPAHPPAHPPHSPQPIAGCRYCATAAGCGCLQARPSWLEPTHTW